MYLDDLGELRLGKRETRQVLLQNQELLDGGADTVDFVVQGLQLKSGAALGCGMEPRTVDQDLSHQLGG